MPDALAGARWVFVEDSPFLPARGGGEREHLGMLRAAADAGVLAAVVLPADGDIDVAPYLHELAGVPLIVVPRRTSPLLLAHPRHPYVVASRPVPSDLAERVRAAAPDATGIVLTSYKSRLVGQHLAAALELPLVLRMHNREGPYHRALAEGTSGPRGWVLRWEARRIDADEIRLADAGWVTGIADISAADAEWRRRTGTRPVRHVPPFAVTVDDAPAQRALAADPTVLFLGALDIATNTDAVQWLLDRVWPGVLRRRPDALLLVVGRSPSADLRGRVAASPRTRLEADVPDIAPFLVSAHVAVNPAVSGSGVNIKLVEYLAGGVPMVSTSHATAGLPLRPGVDLLVEDDPDAFAQAVVSLLDDPAKASALAASGRETLRRLVDRTENLQAIQRLMTGSLT